jgi:hypothetical protein
MKKKSILDTPKLKELKKKKKKKTRKKILIIVIIFILFFVGLIFLSYWDEINIQDIQVVGNKIVEKEAIKEVAQEFITGKTVLFFAKSNSFVYPEKKIEKKLAEKYKRLKNITVEVDANDLKTMWITVSEYEGKYLWCGEKPAEEESVLQECYFLDSEGYIFDKAPYFSGEVYFKLYGNTGFDLLNPISSYFSPEYFKKVILLKEAMEKMNLKPVVFYLKNNTEAEFYLSSNKNKLNAPKVLFEVNSDYSKLIENLQSAITTEPLQSDLKNRINSLSYIDLRFGNKIFYKFDNKETNAETEPTEYLAEN